MQTKSPLLYYYFFSNSFLQWLNSSVIHNFEAYFNYADLTWQRYRNVNKDAANIGIMCPQEAARSHHIRDQDLFFYCVLVTLGVSRLISDDCQGSIRNNVSL